MLNFNLKKEWFEKISRGEKRIEYRDVKPYWTKRLVENHVKRSENSDMFSIGFDYDNDKYFFSPKIPCVFVLGYTKKKLNAVISKIEIVDGNDTDLHIDKPVYAIHFELEAEK